jgi:3-oxoadipate enol-lactonase
MLHYRIEGDGPPVVLAHALGCDASVFDGVVPRLAKRYTVVRYDVRCHGASAAVDGPFTIADLAGDLERLLDELRMPAVSIVGLSMGGMIAMALAIAAPPRVRALVLANTTSRYPDAAKPAWTERIRLARDVGMHAVADVATDRLFSGSFAAASPDVVQRYRTRLLQAHARSYAECCVAVSAVDLDGGLPRIAAPTLVIAGGEDVAAPVSLARTLASRIPHATLAVLDRAGHLSAVERPDEFADLVLSFLDTASPPAPGVR